VREKILIVEDDPKNMKVLEMSLRAKGYTLLQATDGEAALEIATKERPDLIIMNLGLPKIDGLEVTRRLRRNEAFNHTPIIAITAHGVEGGREQAINAGCDAYLPKPFNTRQFPGLVAQILLQQHKGNI